MSSTTEYLAGTDVGEARLNDWVEAFDRDGYLFLEDVLSPDWVAELKDDLDAALVEQEGSERSGIGVGLAVRLFERSAANLRLFALEPIVSFAEALIGRDDPTHGAEGVHVVHNNSFVSRPGGGGITKWHQDDPPLFRVSEGEPPRNIRLPVLLFTANYYLTDVTEPEHGGTEMIPGSHLFGAPCPPSLEETAWTDRVVPCLGRAGSVAMFNSQVWHHGGPNTSDRTRYITQVSYARRVIGHKYFPFMNYAMPEHVYADADPRLKRLLGFLPTGAYG